MDAFLIITTAYLVFIIFAILRGDVNSMGTLETEALIQYFIVNKDLGMSEGKTASQVSHVATLLAIRDSTKSDYKHWLSSKKRVVVLKATENTLLKLSEKIEGSILFIDSGFTVVPEDSFTVLGLPIMTRREAEKYVKRLRTL